MTNKTGSSRSQQKRRWGIILLLMVVAMVALIWKLYKLTIERGDYYRGLSESKRTKTIDLPAPRGNIYDRNGVLLAGSRTSFSVQAFKDEFYDMRKEERTDTLKTLIHYIERDGADYFDTFPIESFDYVYSQKEDYLKEMHSPSQKVEGLLRENQLLAELLSKVYVNPHDASYQVSPAARALTAFSLKGSALPIAIDPDHDFQLSFKKDEQYQKLLDSKEISPETTPLQLLSQRLEENYSVLSEVMNHPAVRLLAYQLLQSHGLEDNIQLAPYVYSYGKKYVLNKAALARNYPGIRFDSSAKEDFLTIVKAEALDGFLTGMRVTEDNAFAIPAEEIINQLNAMGVQSNLDYSIQPEADRVAIKYKEKEDTEEEPLDRLKNLAMKYGLLDKLIVSDEYKLIAENALFNKGIYPGISTRDWVYGSERDQNDFLKRYGLEGKSADQAFLVLAEKYGLEGVENPVEAEGIMVLSQRIRAQGNYAYAPVSLCYELSPLTVAKIEEHLPAQTGIVVSKVPVRYYPLGDTACHILGYIGRISTDAEMKKYVKENKYRPNELVGKTGVEESFEDTLHGVAGKAVVQIDSTGNRTATVNQIPPKAGNNLYLTIDVSLQKRAEESLKNSILSVKHGMDYQSPWGTNSMVACPDINSGCVISTDPDTGEVLEMASYPTYDPNLFVTGISGADWSQLNTDSSEVSALPKPLMNLATQAAVPPGSTFKLVAGLSAMENGLNPKKTTTCSGYIDLGGTRFRCLIWTNHHTTHGPQNLYDALKNSCNYYFYVLALGADPKGLPSAGVKVTVDDINRTSKELGLTEKSGLEINYPAESPSSVPNREKKLSLVQSLLRAYLREDLAKYQDSGVSKTRKQLEADMDQIVGYLDRETPMGRSELIQALGDMGYQAETRLPGQRAGLADTIKYSYLNQAGWSDADNMNTMIGQGYNEYTPIKINQVASIIGNKGTDYQATLLRKIKTHDNKELVFDNQPKARETGISEKDFDAVREGMRRVYQSMSGSALTGLPFEAGAKTGTAERPGINALTGEKYAPYSWLTAFAPYDNPKIATTVLLPSGENSWNAAPLCRDIFASYLGVEPSQEVSEDRYRGLQTFSSREWEKARELQEKGTSDSLNSAGEFSSSEPPADSD